MGRTSGYRMRVKMNDATATSAMEGFSAALNRMPLVVRKSMTFDQGQEMSVIHWKVAMVQFAIQFDDHFTKQVM